MSIFPRRAGRIAQVLTSIAAGGLLLAACSSGTSTTATNATTSTTSTTSTTATTPVAPTTSAQAAGGGSTTSAVTVEVARGPMGSYLTDGAGNTLYLFAADTSTASTCYDACASYWPPLTTTGAPQAGGDAQASLLGTTKRTDGTTQITYAGHPLYYYKGDANPGATGGQGLNELGGLWWLVAPTGSAITASGSASPSSAATTSGSEWS